MNQTRTITVDQFFGDNASGKRQRGDLPFETITAALSVAQPGDVIHVNPGTYNEALTLKNGVNLYFEPGASVDVSSGNGSIPIADGTSGTNSAVTCKILGYGAFRRGGAPSGGDNPVISLYNTASNVYIEGTTFENYCTTAQETEVFRVAAAATLKIRQTAPGTVRSVTYDLFVSYDGTGEIDAEFVDLIQANQAILEAGSLVSPFTSRVRIKAKRFLSDGAVAGNNALLSIIANDTANDVWLIADEEIRISDNFYVVDWPDGGGKLRLSAPLIISGGDIAIVSQAADSIIIDGAEIVSTGTNKPAMDGLATKTILNNCTLFPTGTAKSIVGSGTVQCKNCYATENADTGGGVTLLGTLTKVATLTVPT